MSRRRAAAPPGAPPLPDAVFDAALLGALDDIAATDPGVLADPNAAPMVAFMDDLRARTRPAVGPGPAAP